MCLVYMKILMTPQFFEIVSNIKFHENLFNGSPLDTWRYGQTQPIPYTFTSCTSSTECTLNILVMGMGLFFSILLQLPQFNLNKSSELICSSVLVK
jgi:hypothetical protein